MIEGDLTDHDISVNGTAAVVEGLGNSYEIDNVEILIFDDITIDLTVLGTPTPGNDLIFGTGTGEVIDALAGDDIVFGGGRATTR